MRWGRVQAGLWTCVALAIGTRVARPEIPSRAHVRQACATFTRSGAVIEVTVTSQEVIVVVGRQGGEMKTARLRLDVQHTPADGGNRADDCSVYVDREEDQIAIYVPFAVTVVSGKILGQSGASVRFDLPSQSWHTPILLDPVGDAGGYLNTNTVVGYLGATKDLVVARSTGLSELLDGDDRFIRSSEGRYRVDPLSNGFWLGMDATNNRRWSTCPFKEGFGKLAPCPLTSSTLVGAESMGPKVGPPTSGVAQWQAPRFFLFPKPSELVFGGEPGVMFARRHTLWVADLSLGTIREAGFAGRLHDDEMTGRAAVSPDGAVAVFGVGMSRLEPPFLVDSYINMGERLVIVNLRTLKRITDVPPFEGRLLCVAIDHRDHHSTLLINQGGEWESKQIVDR